MSEGASWSAWEHTAAIQSTLANTVRDSKKKRTPFYVSDFHPYLLALEKAAKKKGDARRRKFDCEAPITILRDIFVTKQSIGKVMEIHGIER